MLYHLDTEFFEAPYSIELISIGIVADDGRKYYAENRFANLGMAMRNEWMVENVLSKLGDYDDRFYPPEIQQGIIDFVGNDPHPWFMADFASYDWYFFCRLFGGMMKLPKGWPMYVLDLAQIIDYHLPKGVVFPDALRSWPNEHHALADAVGQKAKFDYVKQYLPQYHPLLVNV